MIWVWAIVALVVWWAIGVEVLMWIDRREIRKTEGSPLNSESREDRVLFRLFSLLWPYALVAYACFEFADYRSEHPGSGRIKSWFQGGGLTRRYIEWRQRR